MNYIQGLCSTAGNILSSILPQNEWRQVGIVDEINFYPLINGKKLSLERVFCTKEGLMYKDTTHWNFGIFEQKSMKVCTINKYPDLDKLDVSYHDYLSTVTLRAESKITQVIQLDELEADKLFPVVIHSDKMFFLRDCGDVAAEWVTDFLAQGKINLRLGLYKDYDDNVYNDKYMNYLMKDPKNIMYPFSDHLKTKNRYGLLNITSFNVIKDSVSHLQCEIEKYDFYPNIFIKTDGSERFPEFAWKNIKIGDCVFENIEPCQKCSYDKVDGILRDFKFENTTFYENLKKNLKIKTGPADLTIDLKYTNDKKRYIFRDDKVYIR